MATEPNDVVLSLRLTRSLKDQVDALDRPRDWDRADLLRELLAIGIAHYTPPPPSPEPEPTTQQRRDARIKTPAWADELLRLHANGLTNAEIAERTGLTQVNVRARLKRMGLHANRAR